MVEAMDATERLPEAGELPPWLTLELFVREPEVLSALAEYPEGPAREEFALTALRIGVMALRQARGQVDAELVRRETQRMLGDLEQQLAGHARLLQERMQGALSDYFDPESGRFSERVNRLVKKDGELEEVIRRQVGEEDSQLCRTLVQHFGQQSPLMQVLSPDQTQGLLARLRKTLDEQLTDQRERVLSQFSLDNPEGALARLVGQLAQQSGDLAKRLATQIQDVVREFSLDEENSALSRLVRNVDQAQKTISAQFSLDDEHSALTRIKRELSTLLETQAKENQTFQEEVKVALGQIMARREERARGTRHGHDFQSAVYEFVSHEAQRWGDVADLVADNTGLIRNCKTGDCLITLGPESPAPEGRIVIEAKQEQKYSVSEARKELEQARKNRAAQIGVFVYSQKIAPPDLEPLSRYGDDLLVVWDAENGASDIVLKAALLSARAICVRKARTEQSRSADLQELDRAVLDVEKRTQGLAEISTRAETIKGSAEAILEHVRKTRDGLTRQVRVLQTALEGLRGPSE